VINSPSFEMEMVKDIAKLESKKLRTKHMPEMSRSHLSDKVASLLDAGCPLIRVHDAGDFFSEAYLQRWISVAVAKPNAQF